MNITRPTKISLITGLAAAALALSACGADNPTTEPAAPATSAAAPSASEPASSAPASPSASASTESSPSPSAKTTEVPENDVDLDVDDQRGDGASVDIRQLRFTGDGFVAIYDGSKLLGSAKTGNAPLTVELDDKITQTGEYRAVLFVDDGNGKFDADEDLQVVEVENDDDDDDRDVVEDDFDYRVN